MEVFGKNFENVFLLTKIFQILKVFVQFYRHIQRTFYCKTVIFSVCGPAGKNNFCPPVGGGGGGSPDPKKNAAPPPFRNPGYATEPGRVHFYGLAWANKLFESKLEDQIYTNIFIWMKCERHVMFSLFWLFLTESSVAIYRKVLSKNALGLVWCRKSELLSFIYTLITRQK